MSSNNRLIAFVVALLLGLSGCVFADAEGAASGEARLARAIENGVLLVFENEQEASNTERLAEAYVGRIYWEMETLVRVHYPKQTAFYPENSGGRLRQVHISNGDWVKAGDVLVEIVYTNADLQVEREELVMQMEQAEQQHINEKAQYVNQIDAYKNSVPKDLDDLGLEIYTLKLQKMELDYQAFLKRYEESVSDYNEWLAAIDQRLVGEIITAPFDGYVTDINGSINRRSELNAWTYLFTLADTSVFQLYMEGQQTDVVRFGNIIEVTDGEITFDARVVSDPLAKRSSPRPSKATFILEPIDDTVALADLATGGRRFMGKPIVFEMDDVLIVPVQAVRTEDTRRYVLLYEDDMIKKRYIQVGMAYKDLVQVLSGLEAGQQVVLN